MSSCSECWNACFSSLFKDEKKKHPEVKYMSPEAPLFPYTKDGPMEKTFFFQQTMVSQSLHPSIVQGAAIQREPERGRPKADSTTEDSDSQAADLLALAGPGGPFLRCSISYDIHRRVLGVYLSQLIKLKDKCNTVVSVLLHPSKEEIIETKVVCNSQNPVFDETVEFTGLQLSDARRQTLLFRIYYVYENSTKGPLLGTASLPLEEADLQGLETQLRIDCIEEKKVAADLESRGEVLIAVSNDAKKGILHGVLLKAANIRCHSNPDPYGKINLIFKGQRVAKWKSSTKINSLAPVYNEAFHFEVRKMDISDISLQFILLDEDKLHTGQDGTIGYIVLGDHSPSESGCKQWASIKSNPGTSFTSWHSLIAK